jgi:4-diphosphocytidyl-2-C-methyl-D-erythritol kinase
VTGPKTYHSPFKINLGLEVLSKRPDGYHEINTVFYRFDEPYDVLTVTEAEAFSFETSDPDLPTDERNLVVRAFKLCSEYQNKQLPNIAVQLEKIIPLGAGLGGGSANAATAIKIYSELVGPLSPGEQLEIGSKLGADVPFFLQNARAAKASGIGNVLEPIEYRLDYSCLIVKPRPLHASTTASYAGLKISGKKTATDLVSIIQNDPPSSWQSRITNDFEPLVFQRYPELKQIRQTFLDANAIFTLMSGSGGASYGLFNDMPSTQTALTIFQNQYPDSFAVLAE